MDRSALARHLVDEAQLRQQLEREYLLTGAGEFDTELGGIPRGAVTEVFGAATSGKTSFLVSVLSRATAEGEFCALIDASDSFDPSSAIGADLSRLLWVRCRNVEQALRATDLLVHSGGWGVVALDLSGADARMVRKIPMSWWYRFRRAVEHTPCAFLVVERDPYVKNCAAMMLEFERVRPVWTGEHRDYRVLRGAEVGVAPRKPARALRPRFRVRARV